MGDYITSTEPADLATTAHRQTALMSATLWHRLLGGPGAVSVRVRPIMSR